MAAAAAAMTAARAAATPIFRSALGHPTGGGRSEATCRPSGGLCASHVSLSRKKSLRVQATQQGLASSTCVPTCLQLSSGLRSTRPDGRLLSATWQHEDIACDQRRRRTTMICASAAPVAQTAMAATSLITLLPPQFGFVTLTALSSAVLVQWQALMVAGQRKKLGIKYPTMYEDKPDSVFNCYQRAHANTLEYYPQFLSLLLLGGLTYPVTAAGFGMLWVVGRVFYSLGYYTGNPANRMRGAWNFFGLFGLMILAGVVGVQQVKAML
ncbi:hypothetical protein CBR_g38628 [Chara braunii]|uniref:Glutathione S-transferase 3, mitochondrial n=1 Tax=Chara braunii TaxID=69332 RepID=A0A388K0H2_CHABU|nr:hypothetical protein CBR_g38628 [Chara braunii]|eukprot:GBG63561.1 hypothetical protein CBR_g38628 [Chara braunii]